MNLQEMDYARMSQYITEQKRTNQSPTNQQMLTALDESITKWKNIVNGGQANKVVISSSCPLCSLIHSDSYDGCPGCVIKVFTSKNFCKETPYYKTSDYSSCMSGEKIEPNIADNQMLVMLYEIRRDFIIKMSKGE